MNTQKGSAAIVAVIIGVILIGGGVWYLSFSNETVIPESDGVMPVRAGEAGGEEKDDAMMEKDESAMMKDGEGAATEGRGNYEVYAPEKLARADDGDVVLFFKASWCPTCKALDGDIKANASSIPSGVTILEVDYDNSTDLKRKYNVTYQHTLVQVDAEGNQIAKWSGSPTLASLLTNIK